MDRALIDRISARDQSAVADLYDRHSRPIFGLIFRILNERDEAEDVLKEVFLAVWTRAETYRDSLGSPAGWLVRMARNRAIDRLRARSVRVRAVDGSYSPPPEENPEFHAARGERQRDVAHALDALPPDQRSLIEGAYFLGTGMLTLRQQLQESGLSR